MTPNEIVCLALLAVTAGLAVRMSMQWAQHLPVAEALVAFLGADGLRAIAAAVLLDDTAPYGGFARGVYHAQEALFVGWGFALVALLAAVFDPSGRRRLWFIAAASWVIAEVALVMSYPEHRGASRGASYGILHVVTTVFATGVFVAAVVRELRRPAVPFQESETNGPTPMPRLTELALWELRARSFITPARETALWFLAAAMAAPAGPYLYELPSRAWSTANLISAIVLAVVIVRHVQWIRGKGQPSPSTRSSGPSGS